MRSTLCDDSLGISIRTMIYPCKLHDVWKASDLVFSHSLLHTFQCVVIVWTLVSEIWSIYVNLRMFVRYLTSLIHHLLLFMFHNANSLRQMTNVCNNLISGLLTCPCRPILILVWLISAALVLSSALAHYDLLHVLVTWAVSLSGAACPCIVMYWFLLYYPN